VKVWLNTATPEASVTAVPSTVLEEPAASAIAVNLTVCPDSWVVSEELTRAVKTTGSRVVELVAEAERLTEVVAVRTPRLKTEDMELDSKLVALSSAKT
jgi:hypothetical protein